MLILLVVNHGARPHQADPVSLHTHPLDKVEILELTTPNTEVFNKVRVATRVATAAPVASPHQCLWWSDHDHFHHSLR